MSQTERRNYNRVIQVEHQTRAINLGGTISATFYNEKAEAFVVSLLESIGFKVSVRDVEGE